MNEVHLRVADGRRVSSEDPERCRRLLDGMILPRLERPGRYVGLQRPQDLEVPPAQAPVHLLWPRQPEGPPSPQELEPLRRALRARGLRCSYGCNPTSDLLAQLRLHGLRAFAHDSWIELGDAPWLVWLQEPGQLLDLLHARAAAAMPLRSADGGARVLVAGPACLDGFALAAAFVDEVLPSVDPEAIVRACERLLDAAPRPRGEAAPLPAPRTESQNHAISTACVGARELGLPWQLEQHDRDALPHTRLLIHAASESLRAGLGLPSGPALRDAIEHSLQRGSLELHFTLGLPGESDADRSAIVVFAEQCAELAGDRRRRVSLRLAFYRDSTLPVAELESWAERIGAALGRQRLSLPLRSALLRDRRLLAATAADADWLESLFLDGMWSVESELAQSTSAWDNAPDAEIQPRPGTPTDVAHAPTGLRQEAREPQAAARPPADRWRRWSAMIPQQFDYRLEFARRGRLRHLSHRETGELLLHACREAGLEVATAGIAQPRPKLSFGPSLAVGVEGLREYVDLSLTRKQPHLQRNLEKFLPAGFQLARVRFVPGGIGRHGLNNVVEAAYEVALPAELHETLRARIAAQSPLEQVLDIRLDGPMLRFALDLRGEGKKLRPRDLLARLLDGTDVDLQLLMIRRTRLRAQLPGSTELLTPMELVERLVHDLRARERACA